MNVDGMFGHLIFEFLVLDICIERLRHSVTTSAQNTLYGSQHLIIPPANEVAGVYSDPYVRPFVRSFVRPSVRPSQSLIRYSSKTAEQNFMKLSGIVHYMMPYCTSYFNFLSA